MDSPEETVARMSEARNLQTKLDIVGWLHLAAAVTFMFLLDQSSPVPFAFLIMGTMAFIGAVIIKAVRALLEKEQS